ncbi:MAG TPA: hypothetical protein PLX89_00935 [Verrucomicrobiota bacterium]|nr:hypothetical protein [Verrucomicrobiales bacterium]HRI11541.1 hypothetical protein [Verrucomicrobiota bacterium]
MNCLFRFLLLLAPLGLAAAAPTNELQSALAKLNSASSYAWKTTSEVVGVPFSPGPQRGVVSSDGWACVTGEMNGVSVEVVLHGTNGVAKTANGWKTAAELPPPQFGAGATPDSAILGRMLLSVRSPTVEASALVSKLKGVRREGAMWSGELTPEAATEMASFRRGQRGGPEPKNAKGNVRYWLEDGKLTKYAVTVESIFNLPDGSERTIGRTTTVEFSDVGTAKVDVPVQAKLALGEP